MSFIDSNDSTNKHHHHHHHHHHHDGTSIKINAYKGEEKERDGASEFKRRNLMSIRRRKIFQKWGLRILAVIAAIMVLLALFLPL